MWLLCDARNQQQRWWSSGPDVGRFRLTTLVDFVDGQTWEQCVLASPKHKPFNQGALGRSGAWACDCRKRATFCLVYTDGWESRLTFFSPLLSAPGSRFFVEPCAMATHLNKRIQQTVVSPSTCQIVWPVAKSTGLAARTMPPASNCKANLAVGLAAARNTSAWLPHLSASPDLPRCSAAAKHAVPSVPQ